MCVANLSVRMYEIVDFKKSIWYKVYGKQEKGVAAMELFWIIVGGALLCGGAGTFWHKKNKKK